MLTSKSKLKSHETVVHLGIRSFNCSFCDRKFSSKHNLKAHKESVHNLSCKNCLTEFKEKSKYEEHIDLCSSPEVQYVTKLYDVLDVSVKK